MAIQTVKEILDSVYINLDYVNNCIKETEDSLRELRKEHYLIMREIKEVLNRLETDSIDVADDE